MSEYIKREDAKIRIFEYGVRHRDDYDIASACENLERQMNAIPSADVLERKTGKWVTHIVEDKDNDPYGFFKIRYYCSACGHWQTHGQTKFCHNCGAEMERGEN